MAAFATYSDLVQRLGITLNGAEQARATALLAQASNLVRQAARQDIDYVADDILILRGVDSDRIRLPQRPVIQVVSITTRDTQTANPAVSVPGGEWYLDKDSLVKYQGAGWGGPNSVLTITYDHGYTTVPELAKQITLEAVVRAWINPGAVQSETHGSETAQFGQEHRGLLLTDREEAQLSREFGVQRIWSVEFT